LRKAHAVHPIAAVQNEYSLWSRNVELGVLDACKALGVAMVAFSPVARGFFSGTVRDANALDAKDIRRAMPRFQGDNLVANLKLLDGFNALAAEAGCTPNQLALAWLLAQGEHIIPIPGTTSIAHLEEDVAAADVVLSPATLQRADALINQRTVAGPRYNAATQTEIDTEEF
jgi:aryl-alcohol dehydrogenase-like predicted oxidoreductase